MGAIARSIGSVEFNVSANTARARQDVSRFQRELQQGVYTITGSLSRAGNQLSVALTAPIVAGAAAAAKAAIEVEKLATQAGAITSLSERGNLSSLNEYSDRLAINAREIAAANQFTSAEVAKSQVTLARAGFTANSILAEGGQLVRDIGAFATAADIELNAAADNAAKILGAFGLTTEAERLDNFQRITDVLNLVASSAATNVTELGHAIVYAGPLAQTLGVGVEELGASLGVLANAGFRSTMAGTSLRAIMKNMIAPTKQSAALMEHLGINLLDSQGEFIGLTAAVQEFDRAFNANNISQSDRGGIALQIFGQRGGPGFLNLLEEANGELVTLEERARNAEGTTRALEEAFLDTTAGKLEFLQGAIESLAIRVFDAGILDFLKFAAEELQGFVDRVAGFSEAALRAGVAFTAIVAAAGPAIRITGFFVDNFLVLGRLFTTVGAQILTQVVAPIGLFVGAITLAYQNSERFRDALADTGNIILSFFGPTSGGNSFFENLGDAIKKVTPQLRRFGESFGDSLGGVVERVNAGIRGIDFQTIFISFGEALPKIFGFMQQFGAIIGGAAIDIASGVASILSELSIDDFIAIAELIGTAVGAVAVAVAALASVFADVAPAIGATIGFIANTITTLVESLDTLGGAGTAAKVVIGAALIATFARFSTVAAKLPRTASAINGVTSALTNFARNPANRSIGTRIGSRGFFDYYQVPKETAAGIRRVANNVDLFTHGTRTFIRQGNEFVSTSGRMRVAVSDFGRIGSESVQRVGRFWVNSSGQVVASASRMAGALTGLRTAFAGLASGLAIGAAITVLFLGASAIINRMREESRRIEAASQAVRDEVQNSLDGVFDVNSDNYKPRSASELFAIPDDFFDADQLTVLEQAGIEGLQGLKDSLLTDGLSGFGDIGRKILDEVEGAAITSSDNRGFANEHALRALQEQGKSLGEAFQIAFNQRLAEGDSEGAIRLFKDITGEKGTSNEIVALAQAQVSTYREELAARYAESGPAIRAIFDELKLDPASFTADLPFEDVFSRAANLEQKLGNLRVDTLSSPLVTGLESIRDLLEDSYDWVGRLETRFNSFFGKETDIVARNLQIQAEQQNLQDQILGEETGSLVGLDTTRLDDLFGQQGITSQQQRTIEILVDIQDSGVRDLAEQVDAIRTSAESPAEALTEINRAVQPYIDTLNSLVDSGKLSAEQIQPFLNSIEQIRGEAANTVDLNFELKGLQEIDQIPAILEAIESQDIEKIISLTAEIKDQVVLEKIGEVLTLNGTDQRVVDLILEGDLDSRALELIRAIQNGTLPQFLTTTVNIAANVAISTTAAGRAVSGSIIGGSGLTFQAQGGLVNFGQYVAGEAGRELILPDPRLKPVQYQRALAEAARAGFFPGGSATPSVNARQVTYSPSYTINGVSPDQVVSRIRATEEIDMMRIGGVI